MIAMKLTTSAFQDGDRIPGVHAFCVPGDPVSMSENINPDFAWEEVPEGTKSFIFVCNDPDVPTDGTNVNKEGLTVPKDLLRADFYHWVLVDLPPNLTELKRGEWSQGITARGKQAKEGPHGTRQGLNDYTNWFKGDEAMEGKYFGYDGPCPPWNDELVHRYVFTVYALDVEKLEGLPDEFTGSDVLKAIEGHVLGHASVTGTYTLYKALL